MKLTIHQFSAIMTSHSEKTITYKIFERNIKTFDKFNFNKLHVGATTYRHEPEFFYRLSTNRNGNPQFLDNKTPIQRLKRGILTNGITSGRLVTRPTKLTLRLPD